MKKLFLLSAIVLLVLLTAMPVMADSPKTIPVTAKTYSQTEDHTNDRVLVTDDGIVHVWGTVRTGSVDLTIDGQPKITGTLREIVDLMKNPKAGIIVIQNRECVWTFAGGSFEGEKQTRMTIDENGKILTVEQHVVFQGSGIFEGCTMKLTQEIPPVPPMYAGTILIH
jgi:hypothetical protein